MKTSNIILTVALVLMAGFGVGPIRKVAIEREVKNKQLFIQKQSQIERLSMLEKVETVADTGKIIPTEPEQIELINDVNRIAKKTGFTLPDAWSFSIGKNSDVNAEQISISFPLSGRRKQIQNFLQEVENNPRFMGTNGLSFITDSSLPIPRTEMNISLYAFFIEG